MNVAIQEMRHTNLRLKDENERLKEIAQSHETITTKLHEDVRTLLDKVFKLTIINTLFMLAHMGLYSV